jgi:hypothetical protein
MNWPALRGYRNGIRSEQQRPFIHEVSDRGEPLTARPGATRGGSTLPGHSLEMSLG